MMYGTRMEGGHMIECACVGACVGARARACVRVCAWLAGWLAGWLSLSLSLSLWRTWQPWHFSPGGGAGGPL